MKIKIENHDAFVETIEKILNEKKDVQIKRSGKTLVIMEEQRRIIKRTDLIGD